MCIDAVIVPTMKRSSQEIIQGELEKKKKKEKGIQSVKR